MLFDRLIRLLSALVLLTIFLAGCATVSEIPEAEEVPVDESAEIAEEETEFRFDFDINDYRVRPEYAFHANQNVVPAIFEPDSTLITESARNAGFRVQVISTQDVRKAEDVRREVAEWLFNEVPDYDPEIYLLFRQPFFRLHVGDFRSRSEAITFNNILKRRFPDAWVVHDQIDPDNITRRIQPQNQP